MAILILGTILAILVVAASFAALWPAYRTIHAALFRLQSRSD